MYKRNIYQIIMKRMLEPRKFIQVLSGPRQVGKTTLIRQIACEISTPLHYISADEPTLHNKIWLEQQWNIARLKLAEHQELVLVLDEIQKIPGWSEAVKRLWDEDTIKGLNLKLVILGSAPLLIQDGLSESLAGRFEIIHAPHWSFGEMKDAFGWSIDQYVYFGGYPGAASLITDEDRWRSYINESLIETTISRDILLMSRVNKPALLRQLFQLGCLYSGQILSYQKMLGQLHDAGNTTTLAHYLELLSAVGMITGLEKFSSKTIKQKKSTPKLQVLNTALMTAQSNGTFEGLKQQSDRWGRWVESTIAAHLLNQAILFQAELFYWREGHLEVDFIIAYKNNITAIEVKSGGKIVSPKGLLTFKEIFKPERILLIGNSGLTLEQFLLTPFEKMFA